MSAAAPRITKLAVGGIRKVELDGEKLVLSIYGNTERGSRHELTLAVSIGQVPWMIRSLWRGFAAWRRGRRVEIARMEAIMGGAAEIGVKEGEAQ